jgi:hypothetical protein
MAYKRLSSQVILGALVVLLGLVLLLDSTGVRPMNDVLLYVPSLFVLVGLYALIVSRFANFAGPLILIVVAGTWQAIALDYLELADVAAYWPVFVIIFGLSLLLGRVRPGVTPVDDSTIDLLGIFGGVSKRSTSKAFRGATLTALFGGAELDLRDAVIVDRPARVSTTALFGGADVIVPRDWNVQMDVLPIFGGAEDERARLPADQMHEDVDLVVTGFTAFGGVSVSD